MARVLTEDQMLLGEYLISSGCSKWATIEIVLAMRHPKAMLKMLEFCLANQEATEKEFLEAYAAILSDKKEHSEKLV